VLSFFLSTPSPACRHKLLLILNALARIGQPRRPRAAQPP